MFSIRHHMIVFYFLEKKKGLFRSSAWKSRGQASVELSIPEQWLQFGGGDPGSVRILFFARLKE